MSATGNVSGIADFDTPGAGAIASLNYHYAVVGPVTGVPVPVIYSGSFPTSAAGNSSNAYAQVQVQNAGPIIDNVSCASSASTGASSCGISSFVDDFTAFSNTVYFISLFAQGKADVSGQFSATIDPHLEIGPTFLAENPGYSVELSSNVSQSPVPLPAAAWLLLSALGGLGLMGRGRKL